MWGFVGFFSGVEWFVVGFGDDVLYFLVLKLYAFVSFECFGFDLVVLLGVGWL